jgi:hypothetical protein
MLRVAYATASENLALGLLVAEGANGIYAQSAQGRFPAGNNGREQQEEQDRA